MSRSLSSIKPRRLRSGATIGIVAPASPPLTDESLNGGIAYLENQGFRVKPGDSVKSKRGYLAGSDEDRARDLHAMFSDDGVDAVFAVRGGYGCTRILHCIDYDLIRRNPKIFVGYSDITALHCAIFKRTGLITFSGPMVAADFGNGVDQQTESFFWSMLMDGSEGMQASFDTHAYEPLFNKKEFTGTLLGGNLSVLCSLLGTVYFPDCTGAVLALEETGEAPYRIDRMLNQLKMNRVLQRLSGVVLGQFFNCVQENQRPTLTLDEIFGDYFSQADYPVITNFPFGHEKRKITLPIGATIRYEPDGNLLTIVESPVN